MDLPAVRKQAPVLVENLVAALDRRPPAASYDGYTSCPVVTGYGSPSRIIACSMSSPWP